MIAELQSALRRRRIRIAEDECAMALLVKRTVPIVFTTGYERGEIRSTSLALPDRLLGNSCRAQPIASVKLASCRPEDKSMDMRIPIAAAVLSSFALSVHAQGRDASDEQQRGEIALSNDTLQLRYIGREGQVGEGGRIDGAFFLSEQRDIVLSGGAMFSADLPDNVGVGGRLTLAFGPEAYAALLEEENNDVFAMSLGAEARFVVNRRIGLAISGRAFYAPDILTFGSADSLTDLSARAELQVAPELVAFGGMRWFEFDLTEGGGKRTLQEELFFGVGYRF